MQQAERLASVVYLLVCTVYLILVCVSDRIRFAMWCGNDYLPAFQGVGWTTVKKIHTEYESLDEDSQVALTHHHHPHRGHHHHPHSSHKKPLSPSQEQFLLQLLKMMLQQNSGNLLI